ncbi:chaplin family protein [Streptomyces sp. Ac-502]|uniref:chaplin family protein n=1 Tax=Streptomyces sp. Ac-502 TaxID=3342801 RepID=UPI003862C5C4
MQHIVKRSVLVAATATGMLTGVGASAAHADAGARGASLGSPGVLAGNLLQVPAHVPVNVCGNTVDVIGLLNPAFGNTCVNTGSHNPPGHQPPGHKPPGHKPPGSHQPPGHQPPGHKPPGSHQPPGHQPPGHKPPGHQPPGHKPPAHETPGTPGPGGHRPPTDPQLPGQRPPAEVAGAVDSRPVPAAHHHQSPSATAPAGGKGQQVEHGAQSAQLPTLAQTGSSHVGATAVTGAALLLGGAVLFRRSRTSRA